MDDKAFHNIWERVLLSTLYSLGVLGLVGFSVWLAWSSLNDKKSLVPASVRSYVATSDGATLDRDAVKENFRRLLFSGAKPCAVREKKISDISACSVFGIQLGDSFSFVKRTVDGSGFFTEPATLHETCRNGRKQCQQRLHISNGNFTLSVEFEPEDVNPEDHMTASKITAILSPKDNPYATAQSLKPAFVALFGRPDRSEDGKDYWGGPSADTIQLYGFDEKLWVVFQKHTKGG
ncbi:hypothetical protein JDN40_15220 [Rhodomicrobium vannielii ATCC 17100]|uniref:hypothetical protein n=1 Tax=Rhodomicrobium vannielii TaxID=1069 RepID=UPI00191882BB|nr:hypothetical protein [Rhodomicrobium vannielii]MBJ7535458.1 hypothetical protein [Rhodomicrobium vannielii ATCC 17100]